jgi:hypothetical protein
MTEGTCRAFDADRTLRTGRASGTLRAGRARVASGTLRA